MANTVILKNYLNIRNEYEAAAEVYPGMLLELTSAGKVQAHDTADDAVCMVAVEDELQGNGMDDAYSSGDQVQCWVPQVGDEVYAILVDGQDISTADFLQSNGDGKLKADDTGVGCFQALEDKDLSGSSGEESSGPLGYDKRIKVRVVRA